MTSRTTKTRRVALAIAAISSLVLLAACGSDPKPAAGSDSGSDSGSTDQGSEKPLVFSALSLEIPAIKGLSEGFTAMAKEHGYDTIVQDPALDAQKQVTDLSSVIDTGRVAGGYVNSVTPASMSSVVQKAQEKQIPLLLIGTPEAYGLDGLAPGLSFDTIDYDAQGKALGEELGNCINEKLDGQAEVIWGNAPAGAAGAEEIQSAAEDALKATAPEAKIVSHVTVEERAKVQTDVGNALQGNPDANAVMGFNDEGALGAIGAYKAAGKELPCVVNFGGNDEVLAAVKAGQIYATVVLQFDADLKQSMDLLVKMIDDPAVEGVQLTVPQEVVKADG